MSNLSARDAAVRAAAVEGLMALKANVAGGAIAKLLDDDDSHVRRAAALAVGRLEVKAAADKLLALARDGDPSLRQACLESLRLLREPRVVPLAVAAVEQHATQLTALQCLADLGGPDQLGVVIQAAKKNSSAEVVPLAVRMISQWSQRTGVNRTELEQAVTDLHGLSGLLVQWHAHGPMTAEAAATAIAGISRHDANSKSADSETAVYGKGPEQRVSLQSKGVEAKTIWLAYTDLNLAKRTPVQMLSSASGAFRVWLNGRSVYQRSEPRSFQPDSDRFDVELPAGKSRLLVQISAAKGQAEFHLRFRRKSTTVGHERLAQAALAQPGNIERGRKVLFDVEKSLCLKCHRLGQQGESIGPDLNGIGGRFPRIHLIESILEPSRSMAAGFQSLQVQLKDGRTLLGLKISESDAKITLVDNQGKKFEVPVSEIEQRQSQAASIMPDGLAARLSEQEFTDLVAFLASQKDRKLD
jgi:putative heme-binding domain-containing protein